MKRLLLILVTMFTLSMTSCVTTATVTAQDISYYDDYYYGGVTYPVLYVNAIPYYFYGEQWIIIPNTHYHYIRHYHKPMYFRGTPPRGWVRPHYDGHYRRTYNGHGTYHRPTGNRPDNYRPNNRPQNNGNGYYRPNTNHQTTPRTQTTRPVQTTPRGNGGVNSNRSQGSVTRGSSNVTRGGRR